QRSTDDSRAICSRYPKVRVIDNPTDEFNERDRQLLLLRHARALVPSPRVMHSVRDPIPEYARRLLLDDIVVLHYSALRPTALAAKLRWYSVIENVRGTCPWVFKRRLRYAMHVDFTGAGRLEHCPAAWFRG